MALHRWLGGAARWLVTDAYLPFESYLIRLEMGCASTTLGAEVLGVRGYRWANGPVKLNERIGMPLAPNDFCAGPQAARRHLDRAVCGQGGTVMRRCGIHREHKLSLISGCSGGSRGPFAN